MSILIKGIKIPNKKNGAVLIIYPDGKCAFEDGKTYQAVPVPPHRRLIDAYLLKADFTGNFIEAYPIALVHAMIDDAPTIIPADGGAE